MGFHGTAPALSLGASLGMGDGLQVPCPERRPKHVAIIMDGNGRWALDRGLSRLEGHRKGADVVRDITTFARELEIGYLTLYSFSQQNWCRPPEEVSGLMKLLEDYCQREQGTLMEHGIRLITIGDPTRLPASTRRSLQGLTDATAHNHRMILCLAVDYGGREEIVAAVKRLVQDVHSQHLAIDGIDAAAIETRLDTAPMPDPDLLIRTSGEQRISNFLLWQLAYTELHFTAVRWPDFTRAHFAESLRDFALRQRRFGGITPQRAAPPLHPQPGEITSDMGRHTGLHAGRSLEAPLREPPLREPPLREASIRPNKDAGPC